MAKISDKFSESLSEYLILTGWIKCKPEQVSLKANLGNISLQYPYMTARMQCVVCPELAVIGGRNGILTIIPRSLRDEDKQKIINANNKARQKKGDIELVENPEITNPNVTLEQVVKQVERTGHSVIPVVDRFSTLYGFYVHNPENPPQVPPHTPIRKIMIPLRQNSNDGIPYLQTDDKEKIKKILEVEERKFVPIVDREMVLKKLAFLQKFDTNFIGLAISTRDKWQEEIERYAHRVDTLTIDSSNACFQDAVKILRYAKKKLPDKPFGIGNIIQARDFTAFAANGADYIIGGMGVGSICRTGSERGNGRGQMTVGLELAEARDTYFKKHGRYVYLVLDGAINSVKDMTVALAFADFIMMGNYFNRFYETAGQKLNSDGEPTSEENLIRYVETWGEGHPIARLVAMYGLDFRRTLSTGILENQQVSERYGHATLSGSTVEGVVGRVDYRGRLKPNIERDARYIRTTISNAGATDLESFRKKAVLERASPMTLRDMLPHSIEITENGPNYPGR